MWFDCYDPKCAAFLESQEFFEFINRNISPQGAVVVRDLIVACGVGFIDVKNYTRTSTARSGVNSYIEDLVTRIEDVEADPVMVPMAYIEDERGFVSVFKTPPRSTFLGDSQEAKAAQFLEGGALAQMTGELAKHNAFRKFVNTDRYLENWTRGECFCECFERFARTLDKTAYGWAYVGGVGDDPGQFTNPQGTARVMTAFIVHDDFFIIAGVERK